VLIKVRKAQSTLEYALLISVVVGALLGMQTYLKRSIQGRMQIIGDQMGDQYDPDGTYREENMLVNNAQIIETTTGGTAPSTTTSITGGFQQMNSIREVQAMNEDVWERNIAE